jgi:hypothetical protein
MTEQMMIAEFSYDALDTDTRTLVEQKTSEIRGFMGRAVIEVGKVLMEVKERLPHGGFLQWIKSEFRWSEDTAGNYMRAAREFGDNPNVSEFLAASAMYALSSPSTPPAARDEAMALVEQGVKVTGSQAKAIVQKHKPAPPPKPASTTNVRLPTPAPLPSRPAPVQSIGEIPPLLIIGQSVVPVAAFTGQADDAPQDLAVATPGGAGGIQQLIIDAAPPVAAAPAIDTQGFAYASAVVEFARQLLRLGTVRVEALQEQIFGQGFEAIPHMDLDAVRSAAAMFIESPAFKAQVGFIAANVRVEVNTGE